MVSKWCEMDFVYPQYDRAEIIRSDVLLVNYTKLAELRGGPLSIAGALGAGEVTGCRGEMHVRRGFFGAEEGCMSHSLSKNVFFVLF